MISGSVKGGVSKHYQQQIAVDETSESELLERKYRTQAEEDFRPAVSLVDSAVRRAGVGIAQRAEARQAAGAKPKLARRPLANGVEFATEGQTSMQGAADRQ